ncbi:hypothetical protein ECG_09022 [Echinococcus granulosus]|uniref:Uncharacterized protein n=1 Tax=Echinococcus granulosus TaxID=6210 RepID=A0A068WMP2_ECHGR|nr:hypothetical protein ECG_09022 [Echinococcus granulosus]CDS21377.1 hypothetical protein EgrG_000178200 [Echinococcus granulosus]
MSGDLLSSEQDFTWVSFRFGVAMSRKELANLQLNQVTPELALKIRDNVNDMKWLDRHLCRLLLRGDAESSTNSAVYAVRYYNKKENFLRHFALRQSSKVEQVTVTFAITTLCHCSQRYRNRIVRYYYELPVLQSAPPTVLRLDVSLDILNFPHLWDQFLWTAGGTFLSKIEYSKKDARGGETMLLSEYDCAIFDADYWASDADHECLNLLGNILTSRQTFVVAGSMARISDLTSNFDCMKHMFQTLGGFRFRPFSALHTNWRIWCNRHQNNPTLNLVEIAHWACLDITLRRSRGTRTQICL